MKTRIKNLKPLNRLQRAQCLSVIFAGQKGEKLKHMIEPVKIVDRHAFCVKKNGIILGHLPEGPINDS